MLRRSLPFFLRVAALLLVCASAARAQFTTAPAWADEFSYSGAPDPAKWAHETGGGGWGNNELQHYTARLENSRVENGALVINARQENYGGNGFTSARLHSHGQGDWTYGRIEVRARFTGAAGTWPAIWMLPTDWVYGGWPDSGEIDIMEHVSTHGTSVQASIHTKDYNFQIGTARIAIQPGIDHWNWHTYTLEWFPHRLDVWVDGIRYFSFRDESAGWTKWPFDQRFHLMLNVAVGGWGGSPNFTSETMEVDHVRVFPFTDAPQVPLAETQWFRLVNRQSGKVLDVAGPSTADGAAVHQWASLNTNSQQWKFVPGADGSYKVTNRHSGKLLDVPGGSWTNGTNLQQWADVSTAQQRWWLQPVGGGFYKLVNRETGRVMEVVYNDASNGGDVQQWDWVGGANQQWSVEPLGATAPAAPGGLAARVRDDATTLSWSAVAGASGYRVKRATAPGGPFADIGADVTETSFEDRSRAPGTRHFYKVVACLASLESAPSAEVGVAAGGLPPGWERRDIGGVAATGAANFLDGTFVLEGSGADIWGAADEFRLASVEMNGDGAVVARVDSLTNTDPWAKAGVMIRESTGAGAKHAMMALTPGNGAQFLARATTGGATTSAGGAALAPYWVKLVRSGNTFTGYRSVNGTAWTQVGSATIAMSARVLAGLAVTSHADGVLNAASFSKVSVLPPGWEGRDVGVPALAGAASFSADGEWMLAGSGADIAGTADQFHFVAQSFAGDGSLTARVTAVEATDAYAKAGVMFRESSAADAAYAFAFAGPGTVGFECRTAAGATMTAVSYVGETAPVWLRLTRSAGNFTAAYSTDGATWTPLGAGAAIAMNATASAGLAVTSHNVAEVCESTFESVSLVPAAWSAADIGAPGLPGGAVFNPASATWTVNGSGADIAGAADAFHYASQPFPGDGALVARVTALQNTGPWAKAGVMLRSSTGADSRYAFVFATPDTIGFETRTATGASASGVAYQTGAAPVWLKLTRSGTTCIGWWSADGVNWTALGTRTVTMSATPRAGLAVTAHDDDALNTSTFTNVAATPFTGWDSWQHQHFSVAQLSDAGISAPLADANGDCSSNLLAYAFASNPWTDLAGALPTGAAQGGYLTITFIRRKPPTDLTYAVQVSGELVTWAAATTETNVTPIDAATELVTIRDNVQVSENTKRFIRVRVTR